MKHLAIILALLSGSVLGNENVGVQLQAKPQGDSSPAIEFEIEKQQDRDSSELQLEQAVNSGSEPSVAHDHAQIDEADIAAVRAYGEQGSGVLILESSRSVNLNLGGIDLKLDRSKLQSNVTSVSGATSIELDSSGFGFQVDLSGDYLFEFDKDSLTEDAETALTGVFTLYQEYQGNSISVTGHTDAKGTDDYNLDLSERRAESVKQWFIDQGVAEGLISTQGLGETMPIAENEINGQDNPKGRALNRRVEVVIKTDKKVNKLPTASDVSDIN